MSSFPLTPTNGQVYTNPLGTTYIYDSTRTCWIISSSNGTVPINNQTGTTYTLTLADSGYLVTMNNALANILYVPLNSSVAFPVGTVIAIEQIGTGSTTITAVGGVTLNYVIGLQLFAQYSLAVLTKTFTNTWLCSGDIS